MTMKDAEESDFFSGMRPSKKVRFSTSYFIFFTERKCFKNCVSGVRGSKKGSWNRGTFFCSVRKEWLKGWRYSRKRVG